MALNAAIQWEVRTTGSDNSGGGFKAGAAGTDYSQQDAAQKSGADLTMHATTNTKVQPVAAGVAAADVGNVIQITAGTNWTPGFYEITAQDGTYWTLDRSPAAAAEANLGTYAMGGALLTIAKATGAWVSRNTIWVKSGTYTISSAITVGGGSNLPNVSPSMLNGYGTTRGDDGRPTITTASAIVILSLNNSNINVCNFILDGQDAATYGVQDAVGDESRGMVIHNIKVSRCTTYGILLNNAFASFCEVTDMAAGATAGLNARTATYCWSHDNPCAGFSSADLARFIGCISSGNTGVGFNLISQLNVGLLLNCVARGNSGDGLDVNTSYDGMVIFNCIFSQNGGFGIDLLFARLVASPLMNFNAFYSNTSGHRSEIVAGANDVSLTEDPFVNADGGNFDLNNAAGGGALCRAAALPGAFPGGTTTGYLDIGAVQHQDRPRPRLAIGI